MQRIFETFNLIIFSLHMYKKQIFMSYIKLNFDIRQLEDQWL